MPYINSSVTLKLTDEKKDIIKSKLGEMISVIPGKSEQWLMVGFNDNYALYFRGSKQEKAAFVEVKTFGTVERQYKNKLTAMLCNLFEEELDISKDNIYITFHEIKDWGWNGEMF